MGEETSGHTDGREDMKSDVSKLQILVASNALYNAQLIKDLLYREFHKVAVSTCAELSIPDFEEYGSQVLAQDIEKYRPQVLVLAFEALADAQHLYLDVFRRSSLIHALEIGRAHV